MMKCIIVDDEPLAIDLLSDYVSKTELLQLQQSFSDPIAAMHYMSSHEVDLCFLDIQMSELTGIQFLKIMKDKCQFIMTTAYNEYAVDGYDFNVVDFLLKPITFDRFMIAANRALAKIEINATAETSAKEETRDYIFVKSEYKVQKLNWSDICYLEGMGDYVNIVLKDRRILTLETIKSFQERLPEAKFMRVHKSYIISFDQIEFIERNRIQIKDKLIPVSNSYQKVFWERVNRE